MAGAVFPKDRPRATKSAAEVAFYHALREQLPDGWRAWHSLRLRVGRAWEGEADFVIAVPERGILILEVKGGSMVLEGGHWLQNGQRLKRPPRDQVFDYAKQLQHALTDASVDAPPWGIACVFPDTSFSDGPATGDLDGLVLGARQMLALRDELPALAGRAIDQRRRMPRNRKWIDHLQQLWGETWVPRVALHDQADDARERLHALNDEQLRILDFTGEQNTAVVRGRAGSGKTVVARELCLRRARRGDSALYLCFTDALAKAVDYEFAAHRKQGLDVRAVPVRRYACEVLEQAGERLDLSADGFWDEVCLPAACSQLPERRPQLIAVDEALDMSTEDWDFVRELSAGDSIWAFADEAQRFWTKRATPEDALPGAASLSLIEQHRNPEFIHDFAAAYRTSEPTGGRARRASSLRLVMNDGDLLARLRHELTELRRDGADPRDIAVLTLAGQTTSELLRHDRVGDHRLVRADADDAPRELIADTFLRFKGLERPFIIVVELELGRASKYDTRMHIALTRATSRVIVLCSPTELEADPRLQRALDASATD